MPSRRHARLPVSAAGVAHEVVDRLRDGGPAESSECIEQVLGRPPGVEGPADRRGGQPQDGRTAARLDVRHQPDEPAELALQRPGGHEGEVGLDEDVIDCGRQGDEVGQLLVLGAPGERSACAGERAERRDPEPFRLAQDDRKPGGGGAGVPQRPVPGERGRQGRAVERGPGLGPPDLGEDVGAQRPDRWPGAVGSEGEALSADPAGRT